jgi:hypothetical protein
MDKSRIRKMRIPARSLLLAAACGGESFQLLLDLGRVALGVGIKAASGLAVIRKNIMQRWAQESNHGVNLRAQDPT